MIVRQERVGDVEAVSAIHRAAFPPPVEDPAADPIEVGLLAALRADDGWLPALSLVAADAEAPDDVVGHVVCTRAWVEDVPVLGLGPIAVRPDRQGAGIGSALMHAVLGAAEALDAPLVGLLGAPGYYRRFGFVPSTDVGIVAPDPAWGGHFQVRPLGGVAQPTGRFRYATPFDEL